MAKKVTIQEAYKEFLEKYNDGKVGKHISMCNRLYRAYQRFCFDCLDREAVSSRVQKIMVKDMMENMPENLDNPVK